MWPYRRCIFSDNDMWPTRCTHLVLTVRRLLTDLVKLGRQADHILAAGIIQLRVAVDTVLLAA